MHTVRIDFNQKIIELSQLKVGQFAEVILNGKRHVFTVACSKTGQVLIDLTNPENQYPDLAINSLCRLMLPGESVTISVEKGIS